MAEQLIPNYHIKLATPECFPKAEFYRASIELPNDITEVLPYLNSELKDAHYDHGAKVLLWTNNNNKYAFRPKEIAVAPVESRQEAQKLFKAVVSMVNDIWCRREKMEPNFEGKKAPPHVLDIYKLLPKTNCRECGFTCMAFATALRTDPSKLSLCPYLSEKDYANLVS